MVEAVETFGMRLVATRLATIDPETGRHYTQAKVASLCGVDLSTERNWERDRSMPFHNNRRALLDLFPGLFSKRQG